MNQIYLPANDAITTNNYQDIINNSCTSDIESDLKYNTKKYHIITATMSQITILIVLQALIIKEEVDDLPIHIKDEIKSSIKLCMFSIFDSKVNQLIDYDINESRKLFLKKNYPFHIYPHTLNGCIYVKQSSDEEKGL